MSQQSREDIMKKTGGPKPASAPLGTKKPAPASTPAPSKKPAATSTSASSKPPAPKLPPAPKKVLVSPSTEASAPTGKTSKSTPIKPSSDSKRTEPISRLVDPKTSTLAKPPSGQTPTSAKTLSVNRPKPTIVDKPKHPSLEPIKKEAETRSSRKDPSDRTNRRKPEKIEYRTSDPPTAGRSSTEKKPRKLEIRFNNSAATSTNPPSEVHSVIEETSALKGNSKGKGKGAMKQSIDAPSVAQRGQMIDSSRTGALTTELIKKGPQNLENRPDPTSRKGFSLEAALAQSRSAASSDVDESGQSSSMSETTGPPDSLEPVDWENVNRQKARAKSQGFQTPQWHSSARSGTVMSKDPHTAISLTSDPRGWIRGDHRVKPVRRHYNLAPKLRDLHDPVWLQKRILIINEGQGGVFTFTPRVIDEDGRYVTDPSRPPVRHPTLRHLDQFAGDGRPVAFLGTAKCIYCTGVYFELTQNRVFCAHIWARPRLLMTLGIEHISENDRKTTREAVRDRLRECADEYGWKSADVLPGSLRMICPKTSLMGADICAGVAEFLGANEAQIEAAETRWLVEASGVIMFPGARLSSPGRDDKMAAEYFAYRRNESGEAEYERMPREFLQVQYPPFEGKKWHYIGDLEPPWLEPFIGPWNPADA